MADVAIRAARPDEVDAVLELYPLLFEPPGYTPRGWDRERARASLSRAISEQDSTILVADAGDDELVGLVSAYLDLDSVRFGLRCWVEDLAVAPARRSAGIGKALLDSAKAWAEERGATHLELDTGLGRTDAQRFYERERPSTTGYSYSWALS
jgi:ribosomal protein S18 acetylase RimI-like enzyme